MQERPLSCRRWRSRALRLAAAALLVAVVAELTSRLGDPPSPGNLAADARVVAGGTMGLGRYVLRGPLAPKGSPPLAERTLVFADGRGALELDFGETRLVAGILVQADQDDRYLLEASVDGRRWEPVARVGPAGEGFGQRIRPIAFEPPVSARQLRVSVQGKGFAALGALRVYSELPASWPRPPPEPARGSWPLIDSVVPLVWLRLAIALVGAGALLAALRLERAGAAPGRVKRAERILAVAGVLAGLCWWDFFQTGQGRGYAWTLQNHWDAMHYYLGSKYGAELGYTRLYDCVVLADIEAGFASVRGGVGRFRDLRSNQVVRLSELTAEPERCLDSFRPERWSDFAADVGFFRTRVPPNQWANWTLDHGYNPSPAWTALGGAVANVIPLSDTGFALLIALDTLLLFGLFGLAWYSFGTRAVSLALLFFGTSFASGNWWTQGAFLRQTWLFLTVAGLCALRLGRPFASGALLSFATVLRIFPGFFALGVAARALVSIMETRRLRLGPARARFAAAALVCLALVAGISALQAGGLSRWEEFVSNTRKHQRVDAMNTMGLRAVTEAVAHARSSPAAERYRTRTAGEHTVQVTTAVLFAPLLLLAVRRQQDWVAAILASAWIPLITDLGSYYYAYLAVFGFLASTRPAVGAATAALAVAMAGIGVVFAGEHSRAPFVWSSFLIVTFCIGVTALFAVRPEPKQATRRPEPAS